jgi:hypothetical protein
MYDLYSAPIYPDPADTLRKQESLDYSRGYDSQTANDLVDPNKLIYATNIRISTVGCQKTRQGLDIYSVPAGETVDAQQTSLTGFANKSFTETIGLRRSSPLERPSGYRSDRTAQGPVIPGHQRHGTGSHLSLI